MAKKYHLTKTEKHKRNGNPHRLKRKNKTKRKVFVAQQQEKQYG